MMSKIYLVATPIGNLEDITYRAVRLLKEVDLIAAEDTRHTRKLLEHYGILTPLTSFHQYNEEKKSLELILKVKAGTSLALVTDAGMPGISDPGYRLVVQAWAEGVEVTPVPGPTAFVSALVVSGMTTDRFVFEGFFPRKKNSRRQRLQELLFEPRTMIFYEAPHRLIKTLEDIQAVMGEDRLIMIARELTKKYEEKRRGSVKEVLAHFQKNPPKGEIVLVIAGKIAGKTSGKIAGKKDVDTEPEGWEEMSILEHLQMLISNGLTKKQAIKAVALERNLPRNRVYQEAVKIKIK